MIKNLIGRTFVFLLKKIDFNLLPHAKVQNGLGCVDPETNGEYNFLKYMSKLNVSIAFDIGANDGDYSLKLKKHFPNAQIYAFEPIQSTYNIAHSKLKVFPNINLIQTALSSSTGIITLYNDASKHWDKVSTAYPEGLKTFFGMNDLVSYSVNTITLDKFCNDNSIGRINFLKIDIEGGEIEALKGAKKLLDNNEIEVIQFEFNNFNIASQTYLKDFYDILNGYRFYRLSNHKLYYLGPYNADNENFIYQNIVAISPMKFEDFPSRDISI